MDHEVISWQLNGEDLSVEAVRSPAAIAQGLGGRQELAVDGMLFVFPRLDRPVFWMKDMLFPIDIVWIQQGKVVGIERNVQPPAPGTPDEKLTRFPAPAPVDMVLETQPGRIQ
jgi:uncharacterized membrane protein (UPF0127 family)